MNTRMESAVFKLELPCRALSAVVDPTVQDHLFLLGTCDMKGKNQIYLLGYKEETSLCECSATWRHPSEIWQIASCPASHSKDLFMTVHSTEDYRAKHATLWTMENGTDAGLVEKTRLRTQLHRVLWEPQGFEVGTVVGINDTAVQVLKLDAEGAVEQTVEVVPASDAGEADPLSCVTWDPHHPEALVAGGGTALYTVDKRAGKSEMAVGGAHPSVLSVEYNPNKQYHVASAGADGCVKFWDVRHLQRSLHVIHGHNHWATQVRHNPFHEQLVLSASTDRGAALRLWNLPSVSSHTAPPLETGDCLLRSVGDFDDSVYATAWSALSPWLFASVSYSGKVLMHQVPRDTKYSILLSD
eukprot:TRINITY_DN22804_c0_g1_i1.p1 TRINITY_DN22804_c0_g1~~TRINITY_DN22804_c0_g1_i1.p1  ORF type:complete len:356 (+),score=131.96 TRINITY_DN22804_c0_g1_i1:101-1168(+)